ncbi:Pyridoxine 5'-phosphate synthase [Limihaloglobus sulfuriphilus]|uniref:Pyridoxine 5'-phosphate synthase n=1 Tax=Limihaloglobus sulfuriphilus TaxID=1851148 RepID=A0A1Q2MFI0_9BACT|nr:pyridoxine 5'-phosphate synthase [Limihaloglobus sulfuriphilus]AQQ71465.1 Pyridoxine 5'-phosphate synthase [Limihaloglobus sulfuriphilus]
MAVLNVNIDHVATVRQARKADEPDPVWAAVQCELAGANGITAHLRQDRRHINDRDVELLNRTVASKFNLEMSVADEIVRIAEKIVPQQVTLVPEKREELTTEGGLDCIKGQKRLAEAIKKLKKKKIIISAFIVPDPDQIQAAADLGCQAIELHTGMYANAVTARDIKKQLDCLVKGRDTAEALGLTIHAGHGLTYRNIIPVARIARLCEFNIGHSIVARSTLVGIHAATRQMIELLEKAQSSEMY